MECIVRFFLLSVPYTDLLRTAGSDYKVICYLTNWSAYRYNNQLFPLQALDSRMCTHLVYAFAVLNPKSLTIASNETFVRLDRGMYV